MPWFLFEILTIQTHTHTSDSPRVSWTPCQQIGQGLGGAPRAASLGIAENAKVTEAPFIYTIVSTFFCSAKPQEYTACPLIYPACRGASYFLFRTSVGTYATSAFTPHVPWNIFANVYLYLPFCNGNFSFYRHNAVVVERSVDSLFKRCTM